MWERLKKMLADSRLDNEQFASAAGRSDNRDALNEVLNENTEKQTSDHWIAAFNEAGIPCGEINSIDRVFESPQVQHLGLAQSMKSQERGDTHVVGQPIKMSDAEALINLPPPTIGQHTDEVLQQAGYSEADVAGFREAGVV